MFKLQRPFLAISIVFTSLCAAPPALTDEPLDRAGNGLFDRIKSLEGDWYSDDDGSLVSSFKIVAGGHAVMETLFPGSAKEMISMYHLVNGELTVAHYCMLGNQPHFVASESDKTVVLEFAGGTNLDASRDEHIHGGEIEFLGNDKIRWKWVKNIGEQKDYDIEFVLVRKAPSDESQPVSVAQGKPTCCQKARSE